MSNRIIAAGAEHPDYLNGIDALFFEELNIRYKMYRHSIEVTFIENALLAGQCCPRITLHHTGPTQDRCAVYNYLQEKMGDFTFPKLSYYLKATFASLFLSKDSDFYENVQLTSEVSATLQLFKGTRVFSPFALGRLNPLKERPAKWMLAHVKRALANGQFSNLRCNQYLTDDYAHDAACNFRAGSIEAMPLLEDLIESPSGWWTTLQGDHVSICCHSFNSNSFELKLEPAGQGNAQAQ